MKKLILVSLLFCAQAFAQNFVFHPTDLGRFETSSTYRLEPISIQIGKVMFTNKTEAEVTVGVNGEWKKFKAKVLKGDMFYFGENVYEVKVKTDSLSDALCGEYEAVDYVLTFSEEGEYDHYEYVTGATFKAVRSYTYDSCHAGAQSETYQYSQL